METDMQRNKESGGRAAMRFDERFDAMPWDAVDAVVFDIGRVLIHFTPDTYVKALFPGDEAKQRIMMEAVYNSPYWPELDRGTKTHAEAARLAQRDFGGSYDDYMLAMTGWCDLVVLMEEGWRVVRKCREHAKRIYLLSNYNEDCFARLTERFADRFGVFDGRCISYEAQQMKPEPEIYRRLLETYGLCPHRTLFIDDVPLNVQGAIGEGINGFCMDTAGKMDAFFVD